MIRAPTGATRTCPPLPYRTRFRFLGMRGQHLAGGRERHAPAIAMQQADAQLGLKFLYLAAQARLRHRQQCRCFRQASGFGDVKEKLKTLDVHRSEEHTSELQSLMRISYAVFCLKKKQDHENK